MTSKAFGLSRLNTDEPLASTKIRAHRDRFKMCWIHAQPNTAEMIDAEAFRDWPADQCVDHSVGAAWLRRAMMGSLSPIALPV